MQPLLIILYCTVGITIGLFYFGGLWWTVNRMTSASNPQLMVVFSFFLRSALILVSFYYILMAGWMYLFIALGGFLVARLILTAWVRNSKAV